MKLGLYSVVDTKLELFNQPFSARSDAEAKRMFALLANEAGLIGSAPEDFRLVKIGEFDDGTGALTTHEPKNLGRAVEFVGMYNQHSEKTNETQKS